MEIAPLQSVTSRYRQLWLLLAALPGLGPLFLILHYGVDFHFLDEWMPDMAGVFIKAHHHQLTLADILAQHNEHRLAVARLIFLAINPITHWNNVADQIVAWLIVVATSWLVWRLIRRSQPGGGGIFVWFLCNLLIFSPAQDENWLWGMGLANFASIFLVLATILAAQSKLPIWIRLILCLVLASLATISIGNGMLAWPLGGLPLIWPDSPDSWKKKKWVALVWVMSCVAVVLLYRVGYQEPNHYGHPYVRTPWAIFVYCLSFMGSAVALVGALPSVIDSIVWGGVMFLGVVLTAIYFIQLFRTGRREICGRILPWLMVGGYAILSGLIAAFYRAEFGPGQAVSSRYVTYSIYLPIALVNLVSIIGDDLRRQPNARWSWRWTYVPVAGATALILLQIYAIPGAIADSASRQERYRLGKGALLLLNLAPDNPQMKYIGPVLPDRLVETANALSEMGYVHPPLIASNDAGLILRRTGGDRQDISGAMDECDKYPNGLMNARGWAIYPALGRSADCVFITYFDSSGRPRIFAAARMRYLRDDLAGKLPAGDFRGCGWEAILDPRRIPADIRSTQFLAWALDVDTGLATPLKGFVSYQR